MVSLNCRSRSEQFTVLVECHLFLLTFDDHRVVALDLVQISLGHVDVLDMQRVSDPDEANIVAVDLGAGADCRSGSPACRCP